MLKKSLFLIIVALSCNSLIGSYSNLIAQEKLLIVIPDTLYYEIGVTDTLKPRIVNNTDDWIHIKYIGLSAQADYSVYSDINIMDQEFFLSPIGNDGSEVELYIIFTPNKDYKDFSLEIIPYMEGDSIPNQYPNSLFKRKVSSIRNMERDFNFIYPNPASNFINIQTSEVSKTSDVAKMQIFDVLGIEIMSESIHQMSASHRMNVEKLPSGVYFIRIGNKVEKFLKI